MVYMLIVCKLFCYDVRVTVIIVSLREAILENSFLLRFCIMEHVL